MKKTYAFALLLMFFIPGAFAQTGHVFHLNRLSKRDTLVSGWKFHSGDDKQWRNPAFDDSNWNAVDPGQDIQHFDEFKNAGIVWIRVHVVVDSSLAGKTLAVTIYQYAASEIYLDGKLIARYGKVSRDPAKVQGYLTSKAPIIIHLKPGKDNLIAVRLAYQPGLPYISSLFEPLSSFAIYLNDYPSAIANYHTYLQGVKNFILLFSLFGGAILIIFCIHLVYYMVDRQKKVNLYYALFCASVCFITLPNEIFGVDRFGNLALQMWITYVEGLFFIVGMVFLLLTVYSLFNYPNRRIFSVLVTIGVCTAVYMYFNGATGFILSTDMIPLLFMIEGVHVCAWAIKRQIKDAVFVLGGIILFVIFITISSVLDQGTVMAQLLWGAGLIWFPIGMAFYLGVQTSITNKRLVASLAEVQTLSAQKQQILASQNEMLENQVTERTAELNRSLLDLKQTQSQLIQSEKMASLGELTAGIAHEIQNPLNFVNNFSEVNIELVDEMDREIDNGDLAEIKTIAADLKENSKKISMHGKRADTIVKGMLEHSRVGTRQKEQVDLNKLIDDYLRLAYHGLQAKDEGFKVELITDLDERLPKVNVVPQDIGRVMLNLFNNAFYAVKQKAKTAGPGYNPRVVVTTGFAGDEMGVSVKDNGSGIPDTIKDKIMQPFFTTKPTGEGTGLGLSLTYDMVVNGHGGSINVESKEGIYTQFTIALPMT